MARRRNDKSLAELAFGCLMFVVVITMFNPKLRAQLLSTLTTILSVFVLIGIIGLVIYLIIQSQKSKNKPTSSPINRNPSVNPQIVQSVSRACNTEWSTTPTQSNRDGSVELYKPAPRQWDVSVLRDIEWKRFEIVCTQYLRMVGFVASETNVGADGGVDIRVSKPNIEKSEGIVQCKSWNTYKVGVKPIRELFGIMAAERIPMGLFMTSGDFTSEAIEFAKGKINLIWGDKFIHLIKKLSEENQIELLEIALNGDYATPTCPQCDVKMTLRESKKGRNVGGQFWGCINYPRCKQTLICSNAL